MLLISSSRQLAFLYLVKNGGRTPHHSLQHRFAHCQQNIFLYLAKCFLCVTQSNFHVECGCFYSPVSLKNFLHLFPGLTHIFFLVFLNDLCAKTCGYPCPWILVQIMYPGIFPDVQKHYIGRALLCVLATI